MTTFKLGDEVRQISTGKVGVLVDINSNPDYEADDEIWGEAETDAGMGYTFIIDRMSDIEITRRAEDIPAKSLPTIEELADYMSSALHGGWGALQIDETDVSEGDGVVEAFGVSATGQRFSCRIRVSDIDWADF